MSAKHMPGDTCSMGGEYEIIGPRGGHVGKKVSMKKGDKFPPTPANNQTYQKIK